VANVPRSSSVPMGVRALTPVHRNETENFNSQGFGLHALNVFPFFKGYHRKDPKRTGPERGRHFSHGCSRSPLSFVLPVRASKFLLE
jgi:hypothetical protein